MTTPRRRSHWTPEQAGAFGARLRRLREDAGLSQRDLSFPGCTAAYISRVEKGERYPSVVLIRRMAARLDVSADYLETGAGQPVLVDALLGRIAETTEGLSCIAFREDAVEVSFGYAGAPRSATGPTLGDALLGALDWAVRVSALREAADARDVEIAEQDAELERLLAAATVTP